MDKELHTGKVWLSYTINYLHFSVAVATIFRVLSQECWWLSTNCCSL